MMFQLLSYTVSTVSETVLLLEICAFTVITPPLAVAVTLLTLSLVWATVVQAP